MAESKGVWLDKDTGKVVKSAPARGRQLVAPGKDIDSAEVDAIVERYESQYEVATAPDTTEKAVTTKSAAAKK